MNFIQKLISEIRDKKSVVCMGLDPRIDKKGGAIPKFLIEQYEDPNEIILEFNKSLIDVATDLIPIIKPQSAFYEKYDALDALKSTIEYAHKKDILVLLDAKRNDIGSTSQAYADSIYNNLKADACTVNPYLGIDGVKPFLEFVGKGLFVLIKTSNPSSSEFQDLFSVKLENIPEEVIDVEWRGMPESICLERNYIQIAKLINKWGFNIETFSGYSNLGGVVGATYPNQLKKIRKILKSSFLLIPGFGVQGGKASDIKYGFDKKGLGGIVNSSRGIMFAYKNNNKFSEEEFEKAARAQILNMNEKINKEINL